MKRLIIDAGHGGSDPGATANGYIEKELTLPLARRLAELLKKYNPDMTREQDLTLNSDIRSELVRNNYEYCISIHLNAAAGEGSGIETIHSAFSERGKALAQSIANSLSESISLPVRRVFSRKNNQGKDYYYMHRLTGSTTTVIVEALFLDNQQDIKHLNLEQIAQGIAAGFEAYIQSITPEEPAPPKIEEPMPVLRRGDKGEAVKELQRLLGGLEVDGSYGPLTEAAVKEYQRKHGLKVDGVVGPQTWSHLKARPPDTTKYRYYKEGETHIVELDPLDLKLFIKPTRGIDVNLKNYVNASFVWWEDYPKNTKPYPTSMLIYNGEVISNKQPNGYWDGPYAGRGAPTPTFIIYKDGTVTIKDTNDLSGETWRIHLAISVVQAYPEVRTQGFVPYVAFSTVGYATDRLGIFYRAKDNKVLLTFRKGTDINRLNLTGKNLGADFGGSPDSGGSANFIVDGKKINTTSRWMYAGLTW